MVNRLILKKQPVVRPLDQWGTVSLELLGTQTRLVQGERFTHRVIECGDGGEPLILIHGIGGHAETYCRNLHNLANNGFHVYAIDALYHGFSSKYPRVPISERMQLQADALADLIKALGYRWAHVEGESLGAMITYWFGIRHPDLAGKLILNTGFPNTNLKKTDFVEQPGGGSTLMQLSRESVLSTSFDTVRKRMEWLVTKPERMTDEMVNIRLRLYSFPEIADSMRYVYRVGEEWKPAPAIEEEDLLQFKPEALVFWTENNPGRGLDYGEYISTLIPRAKFYGMTDAGHWPQWEKPEEHDQVLIEFIRG